MTVEFGTQTDICRKSIQDISIYFEKCDPVCLSNDCPDTEPYYKHPLESRCVNDCPHGYTENSPLSCVPTTLCHSTCASCSSKNDATQCLTCSSTLATLNYQSLSGSPISCTMTPGNNAQHMLTINKDTIIGTSLLKAVGYNSITSATSGTLLGAFLYS